MLVKNYGIALFLFTFITRLVVFPLSVKQQKSTARMAMISPQLEKLKKKYAKNKEKLNEETMKLYKEENVNPMSSCLPMVITMVILFSLIPVIYSPLTYISNANKDDIEASNKRITNIHVLSEELHDKKHDVALAELLADYEKDGKDPYEALEKDIKNKKKFPNTAKEIDSDKDREDLVDAIKALYTDDNKKNDDIDKFILKEKKVSQQLVKSRPELVTFDLIKNGYENFLPESVRKEAKKFDYNFLGMSLGTIPRFAFSLDSLVFIPFISALLQLATTIVSQRYTKRNNPTAANMGGGMKAMFYIMPLFSLWICFSYPAALGLYWIYSSFFALLQTIVLNVLYTPEKVQEMVKKDMEKNKNKKKNKPSFYEKAMAMQKANNENTADDDSDDDDEEKKLSKAEMKELQRQRINEARRRMAEKYGDEYEESDQ